MKPGRWLALATLACALPLSVLAQTAAESTPTAPPAPPAAQTAGVTIPGGTVVHVTLADALGSATSHQDDAFRIELVEPIIVDGVIVVPAGAQGGGVVIDAAPSAWGGRQGKLVIAGRFLTINGERVGIRGMQLMVAGDSRTNQVYGYSFIPVVGMASVFIHGGEVSLPAGTHAQARIAADVLIQPQTAAASAPDAAPASATPSTSGENRQ